MLSFLKFRDEQDALGPKFLRSSVKKLVFGQLEPIKRQLRIFEFDSFVYFNYWVMCNIPGCIDIFSNNAITLFTSKCILFRDLYKFAQLQPNYAIISLTKRV